MKIEIIAPDAPFTNGYRMKEFNGSKRFINVNNMTHNYDFLENEIAFILGIRDYDRFLNGKYLFDVPVWKLNAVSGSFNAKNTEQNRWAYEYTKL